MNEQQREFAEQLIEDYQLDVNSLYYKINRNVFFAFSGLGLALTIFAIGGEFTPYETLDNIIGIVSGATVVVNSISAVKRICRREALKQRIREIEYDLTMDELSADKPKVYEKSNLLEK